MHHQFFRRYREERYVPFLLCLDRFIKTARVLLVPITGL